MTEEEDERKVENRAVFCWTRNRNNFDALFVVLVLWISIYLLKSGGEDDASYVEQLGRLVTFLELI